MMTFEEYNTLKTKGFSHAPLVKKRLMDAQTPVSVFSKVRDLSGSAYLFESVVGGERWARFSMIGLGSDLILQYADGNMTIKQDDQINVDAVDDPFAYIRKLMADYNMPTVDDIPSLPSFSGGLVGYFGYDMVRVIEPSVGLSEAPNPMTLPDMWLMLSMSVIVFDNLENTLSIIVYADCSDEDGYGAAIRELERIEDKLAEMPDLSAPIMPTPKFVSQTGQDKYCSDVNKIKDYIFAGDVMQVVPAQRLTADYSGDSLAVYRALRFLNPSPYLFLVHGYTLD
ncbi:MAG: chorismate-binding protein, partial [Psychrobacter sp.]